MADWKKLAHAALLADGKIDAKETQIIRDELFADDKIDKSELEFLARLRNDAKSCTKTFTELFFEAVESNVLADGGIDDDEARWLRKALYADGKIDADEKNLMVSLKKKAKKTSPEFDKLYKEVVG
jgi:hypothetical protein